MLCKWCGADVPNSAAKCPRCHKELPAKSDCGGYYDIVSAPKRAEPMGFQQAPTEIVRERIIPQKTKANLVQILLAAVACVGVLLALVLLLGLTGNLTKTTNAANQNGQRAEQILAELRRVRGEKEYQINVSVDHGAKGNRVKTTAKLGDYTNAVSTDVLLDEETGDVRSVQISMGTTKDAVALELDKTVEGDETIVTLETVDVSEAIFDAQKDELTYQWKCKLGGEWVALDDEIYAKFVKVEDNTITFDNKALAEVPLLEGVESLELQVVCTRTNVSDESLKITVGGICVEMPSADVSNELAAEIVVETN